MLLLTLTLAASQWLPGAPCHLYDLAQAVDATARVARVAALKLEAHDAYHAIGDPAIGFAAGGHLYVKWEGSPLVIVYDCALKFKRLAPPIFYWRDRPDRALAPLQGEWVARGLYLRGLKSAAPRLGPLPYAGATVRGHFVNYYSGIPMAAMVSASGPAGREVLSPVYTEPEDWAEFRKSDGLWRADRHLLRLGPALLTATGGPDWVELALWHR